LLQYNINSKIITDKRYKNNTRILKFYYKDSHKLIALLYDNASIYLTRKYNRYLFFKEKFCRLSKELDELLASEIGKNCNVNSEVN